MILGHISLCATWRTRLLCHFRARKVQAVLKADAELGGAERSSQVADRAVVIIKNGLNP